MGVRIEPMTLSDLAEALADHDRFWGGRNMRFLHQRVLVREFGDTCLTARGADDRTGSASTSGRSTTTAAPARRGW